MSGKNDPLLLCLLILMTVSLLSALMPTPDIDGDGCWDSLESDDFLLILSLSAIALLYLVNRFVPIQLALPWLLSFLLILPPITAL